MSVTMEFDITVRIQAPYRENAKAVADYIAFDLNSRTFSDGEGGYADVAAYISASGVVDES